MVQRYVASEIDLETVARLERHIGLIVEIQRVVFSLVSPTRREANCSSSGRTPWSCVNFFEFCPKVSEPPISEREKPPLRGLLPRYAVEDGRHLVGIPPETSGGKLRFPTISGLMIERPSC